MADGTTGLSALHQVGDSLFIFVVVVIVFVEEGLKALLKRRYHSECEIGVKPKKNGCTFNRQNRTSRGCIDSCISDNK